MKYPGASLCVKLCGSRFQFCQVGKKNLIKIKSVLILKTWVISSRIFDLTVVQRTGRIWSSSVMKLLYVVLFYGDLFYVDEYKNFWALIVYMCSATSVQYFQRCFSKGYRRYLTLCLTLLVSQFVSCYFQIAQATDPFVLFKDKTIFKITHC